jgi:hypothetical protein
MVRKNDYNRRNSGQGHGEPQAQSSQPEQAQERPAER